MGEPIVKPMELPLGRSVSLVKVFFPRLEESLQHGASPRPLKSLPYIYVKNIQVLYYALHRVTAQEEGRGTDIVNSDCRFCALFARWKGSALGQGFGGQVIVKGAAPLYLCH